MGERKDPGYAELFDAVFAVTLKPEYRFVAAKPKSNSEHDGGLKGLQH